MGWPLWTAYRCAEVGRDRVPFGFPTRLAAASTGSPRTRSPRDNGSSNTNRNGCDIPPPTHREPVSTTASDLSNNGIQ